MFRTPIQYLPETKILSSQCATDLQLDVIYKDLLKEQSNTPVRRSWIYDFTTNIE